MLMKILLISGLIVLPMIGDADHITELINGEDHITVIDHGGGIKNKLISI